MSKMYTSIYFPNGFPTSTGLVKATTNIDWVDSVVNGTGNQNTILYCRAMPKYKLEDFYQYFTDNEVLWYKFFLMASERIFRIYKVVSSNLASAATINNETYFPTFAYTLNSFVSSVTYTEDNKYKIYTDFDIVY